MFRFFATFLKKGSAKNFPTGKILGYLSKKVRSTVVVNRRAFFLLNYAIGVCGLKFNITNIEFGCRHCRPSLKVFGFAFFKKRMGFGATPHKNGVLLFILSGYEAWSSMALCPSLPVGAYRLTSFCYFSYQEADEKSEYIADHYSRSYGS